VTVDELAAARCEMDQKMYAQEFDASFEDSAARVYHAFDLDKNVADLSPLPDAPLMIGMDFNISPMTAVIAQRAGDQLPGDRRDCAIQFKHSGNDERNQPKI
jgi:hypothetical protein